MKITVTVEIDPQAWADEYGVERSEVRADAKTHLWNSLDSLIQELGVNA